MFTGISPGRGSEHRLCRGWRVWGRGWKGPGAPVLVGQAPALHMSGFLPVIFEARGERNWVKVSSATKKELLQYIQYVQQFQNLQLGKTVTDNCNCQHFILSANCSFCQLPW